MNRSLLILPVLGLSLMLTGCGSVTDALGLGRNPPDEFAVVDRPPLAVPPNFDLRPPKPGAPRPQAVNLQARAASTMYGTDSKLGNTASRDNSGALLGAPSKTASGDEQTFLEALHADKPTPDIRDQIDRDAAQRISGNDHLIDDLLWWRKPQDAGVVVDSKAEAARIKEATDKGQPLNKGATPVIEKAKGGFLGL